MRGRPSQYAEQFEQIVREAGATGVAGPELRERTGASTQTVYTWIRREEAAGQLSEARKTSENKAVRYTWISRDGHGDWPLARRAMDGVTSPTSPATVEPGQAYTLVHMRIRDGRTLITFEDAEHHRFETELLG